MMTVEEAVKLIAAERRDEVVVTTMSGLGLWGEPRPSDFRLLGLMGAAASIGLGIALGRPDRDVWVIDGDGSLLMQLGVLAAIADAAPRRMVHMLIDNGVYAVSGAQPVPGRGRTDWERVVAGAGYQDVRVASSPEELLNALRRDVNGPRFIAVHCAGGRPDYPAGAFNFDASGEAERVRAALATDSA